MESATAEPVRRTPERGQALSDEDVRIKSASLLESYYNLIKLANNHNTSGEIISPTGAIRLKFAGFFDKFTPENSCFEITEDALRQNVRRKVTLTPDSILVTVTDYQQGGGETIHRNSKKALTQSKRVLHDLLGSVQPSKSVSS